MSPGHHLVSLLIFLMSESETQASVSACNLPGKEGAMDGSSMKLIKVFLVWWGFAHYFCREDSVLPAFPHSLCTISSTFSSTLELANQDG